MARARKRKATTNSDESRKIDSNTRSSNSKSSGESHVKRGLVGTPRRDHKQKRR